MILGLLIHRANIARDNPVSDGAGGWTPSLAPIATNVSCRMRSLSLREITTAAQRTPQLTHRLYFLPNQDVQAGDVITCQNALLRVEFINPPSQLGSHIEVDCAQLPPAVQSAIQDEASP